MCGEKAKWCVKQNGRILWIGVLHGGLNADGFGLKAAVDSDKGQQGHDTQTNGLMQSPMWPLLLRWWIDPGLLCHHPDSQYEKNKDYEQIPIVEKHLLQCAIGDFVGMAEDSDEINREVLPEEVEGNDIEEIQENGKGVEGDVNDVNDTL